MLPFRAATPGEANEELALVVTDVLRNRLAAIDGVISLGTGSIALPANPDLDPRETGRKLNAQFLLQGSTARLGDHISTEAELIDAVSGARLWSASFDHSVKEVALLREAIVERVARDLHIATQPAAGPAAAPPAIDLDAYLLYVRGWRLTGDGQQLDKVKAAIELFRRATILDPSFAPGYLALEQVQLQADFLTKGQSPELVTEARQALDRALELNPAFGEAWIDRASLAKDPVKAEEWYRKGLALAPSYGAGYAEFSRFLFDQHRKGEAIEMINRARQLDPLTPDLHVRQAFMLMVARSDVAAHDRLLREALTIRPGFEPALFELAVSKYEYSGEFAQALRPIEQLISQHPSSSASRNLAASIYLDLDDPLAATAVLGKSPDDAAAQVKIAQYQRDPRRAAELAWSVREDTETAPVAPIAEALRDGAIATGDYARVLKQLEARYAIQATDAEPRLWSRGLGLVYAHTLVLAGETERGRKLATSILVQLDAESVGRTENWFCRERAAAFAILGDDERALAELAIAQQMRKYYRWWYLAELDPLYARFRSEPRFRALTDQARKYRGEQRALLEQMRSKGEVPKRG